jgi:hypothetical protein
LFNIICFEPDVQTHVGHLAFVLLFRLLAAGPLAKEISPVKSRIHSIGRLLEKAPLFS